MKNALKRVAAVILVLSFAVTVNAFEQDIINRIYSDSVTVENGKQITIPVKIENNAGFMGFAVFVTYDEAIFTPVSASKGTIVSGLFNDSISTSKTNTFKVVCSETRNVTADGVLFNLNFNVADGISGKYEIELSYSQQDTFNENWSNVVFACEKVEIIVTENGTTVPTTATTTQPITVPTTEPTTQKQETTTQTTTTEPSTSQPSVEETTTTPATEPSTEPSDESTEKLLSVRMREWVDELPFPLNIILGIIIIPISYIVSIFE